MDKRTLIALADNLDKLMKIHNHSQDFVALKTGISQRTIGNMMKPDSLINGCTIGNIEAVAKFFGLEAWHLLIPDQPIELLQSKSIEKLMDIYKLLDKPSRDNIDRISESEVRYSQTNKAVSDGR